MSDGRRAMSVFAGAAVLVLVALAWVTSAVVNLETSRAQALLDAAHAQAVDAALERMDAWISAQVAAEAARPPEAYRTGDSEESWLAGYRGRYVRLHFAVAGGEPLTSPQAPTSYVASVKGLPEGQYLANRSAVDDLTNRLADLPEGQLRARVLERESALTVALAENFRREQSETQHGYDGPKQTIALEGGRGGGRGQQSRAGNNAGLQQAVQRIELPGSRVVERVGLFVPVWVVPNETLVFARRVESPDEDALHGFAVDWPMLRDDLLDQVADLFPDAELEAIGEAASDMPTLAAAPVALRIAPPPSAATGWTVSHTAVMVTWIVALLAFGAGAWSLRSSHAYAERRSRFASAVTHELRTPLTTFRMYADMLASDMVPPERRGEYLATLKSESERLATLVENVLAFSKLERGVVPLRPESMTLQELVDRVGEPLAERALRDGHELVVVVRGPPDEPLHLDAGAVGRVLLNLVDNACKYGASSEQPRVELNASVTGDRVTLDVMDHGPGIPGADRGGVFESFRRGRGREDGSVPGVGLGLALSRELARAMGGDLVLADQSGPGTRFVLTLPAR